MDLLEKVFYYLEENSRFFREYHSYTFGYGCNTYNRERVWRWRPFDRVVDAFIEWKRLTSNDKNQNHQAN